MRDESLTFLAIARDVLRCARRWFRSGTPPPDPQRRMLYVVLFLLVFGIATTVAFVLAISGVDPFDSMNSYHWLPVLSFMSLCPAVYGAYVSLCCWRNVKGYDWWIIPGLDL